MLDLHKELQQSHFILNMCYRFFNRLIKCKHPVRKSNTLEAFLSTREDKDKELLTHYLITDTSYIHLIFRTSYDNSTPKKSRLVYNAGNYCL